MARGGGNRSYLRDRNKNRGRDKREKNSKSGGEEGGGLILEPFLSTSFIYHHVPFFCHIYTIVNHGKPPIPTWIVSQFKTRYKLYFSSNLNLLSVFDPFDIVWIWICTFELIIFPLKIISPSSPIHMKILIVRINKTQANQYICIASLFLSTLSSIFFCLVQLSSLHSSILVEYFCLVDAGRQAHTHKIWGELPSTFGLIIIINTEMGTEI